jgi:imidazolonepropionase-like amidohydrolase
MKKNTRIEILILLAAAAALAVISLEAQEGSFFVIQNATIHTMSSAGTLQKASVFIGNGKILAVGANIKPGTSARVIKADGLEVYPGMVNAWGNLGLTEVGAVAVTNDYAEQGTWKPQLLAYSAIHPASEHIAVARAGGVTSSLSAPLGGVIAGQAVLIHLDGWTVEEMAVAKSAAMAVNFPSLGGESGSFGRFASRQSYAEMKRTYETRVKELSEWLEKARHYMKARQADPATEPDSQLGALVPVVRGDMIVVFSANSERDITNAVEFGKKEKLKFAIQGAREAGRVVELLKKENVPVILASIIALPAREDDPYDERFTLPATLAKAGVKFALTSPPSSDVRNLPYEAGFAQAYGLTHDEALRAVTISPAEILGVSGKIGSIEAGKSADLVITDGDLLELRTQVKQLFIAGKNVSLENKHSRLYQQYLARP